MHAPQLQYLFWRGVKVRKRPKLRVIRGKKIITYLKAKFITKETYQFVQKVGQALGHFELPQSHMNWCQKESLKGKKTPLHQEWNAEDQITNTSQKRERK